MNSVIGSRFLPTACKRPRTSATKAECWLRRPELILQLRVLFRPTNRGFSRPHCQPEERLELSALVHLPALGILLQEARLHWSRPKRRYDAAPVFQIGLVQRGQVRHVGEQVRIVETG